MKLKEVIILCLCLLLLQEEAFAFVNCQSKYDNYPRALSSFKGKCNVCHISPNGSGPTNEFGKAFAANGFKITDDLVSKFPSFFQEQTVTTPTPSGPLKPVIKRIKPKKVKVNVQSMISIMGKNFVDGAKAFIDNNEVVTTFKSNMLLVIDFVLTTVGLHDLKVQNPDEEESNTVKVKGK